MIIFKPFQFLYQTFKGTDQRLFDTFERIHMYLEELFARGENQVLQILGGDQLELKAFYQVIPELTLTLRKPGTWLILVNLECRHVFADGQIEFRLVCNGMIQPGMGVIYNDHDVVIMTGSKFWVYRATIKAGDVVSVKVQARIQADTNAGSLIIAGNNEIIAVWQNSDI